MTTSPPGGAEAADAEIANRITNALIIKNINVRALSEDTGIAYPTLRRSLKGGRSLTFQEFNKIATAINVPPSSLLPDILTAKDAA
jgi:transcriptional regulator with XRE-family HTH domain